MVVAQPFLFRAFSLTSRAIEPKTVILHTPLGLHKATAFHYKNEVLDNAIITLYFAN